MHRPTPPDPKDASPSERNRVMAAIGDTWRSHALLASEAGMSRRRFQLAVTDLVLDGRPILSGPLGYRLTDNPAELDDAAERLRHRATEILARASALRATAARLRDGVGRVQALPLDFAAQQ